MKTTTFILMILSLFVLQISYSQDYKKIVDQNVVFLYLNDFLQTGDETLENNFPLLWDFYKEHKYTGTSDEQGIPHHETLALLYVDIIASALQEWHTGTIVTNSNQILQLYKDMAWIGLASTTPYLNVNNNPNLPNQTDRNRISNRVYVELFNMSNNGLTPEGSPCN